MAVPPPTRTPRSERQPTLGDDTLRAHVGDLARHGDRTAIYAVADDGAESWSYSDLALRVTRLAGGLQGAGIGPGDRVGLMAPLGATTVVAALAVLHRGAAVVPIDVQHGDATLAHILTDSDARTVVTIESEAERVVGCGGETAPRIVLVDGDGTDDRHWSHLATAEPIGPAGVGPNDVAALFYTSGTTGRPKGVPLSQRNLAFQIRTLLDAELVTERDRVLLPLPLHHVYPFVIGMLTPLAIGLPLILPRSLTGPEIVRALQEGRVTLVVGVPRLYAAMYDAVRHGFEERGAIAAGAFRALMGASASIRRATRMRAGRWLLGAVHRKIGRDLRVLASGGSPLDGELARRLEALGWDVAIGYGLTETSPLLTILRPGKGRLDTVGRPVGGIELRVEQRSRESSNEEEEGTRRFHGVPAHARVGEVTVRGPNVFGGYHRLPEATREVLSDDGWFRTGDLGWVDRGGYLHLVGRASTMIVTEGGENVQPEEIEEAYAADEAVREIGVLQKNGRLVAVAVPEPAKIRGADDEAAVLKERLESISRRLPSYQRITDFVVSRDALARTRLGKIQRHKLAERYENARETGAEPSGPMTLEEMSDRDRAVLEHPAARRVWDNLCRRHPDERMTPDTSLQLDLGIDSLAWVDLTLEIVRDTGVELDEETVGGLERVRDLLEAVAARSGPPRGPARGDVLADPESALTDRQRRWLSSLGPGMSVLARLMYWTVRLLAGAIARPRAFDVDRIPDRGPSLLAPNHVSYLDPFVLAAVLDYARLRRTHWAGWTGAAFRNPVFRMFSRLGGVVPIDPDRGVLSSLAFGAAALKNGKALVWFPEGERSRSGELLPFKTGIGMVLERYPVPVVPVWIDGTFEALPYGRVLPRIRRVSVYFGEPIDPRPLAEGAAPGDAPLAIATAVRDAVVALEAAHRRRPR